REVRDAGDRQMLDGARRCLAYGGSHRRRAVRREYDAARAGTFGAAANGAQVPRIAHLIEADDQRRPPRGELVRVRVAVRLAPRDDALMIAGRGGLGELPLMLRLDAQAVQPRLPVLHPLGRPDLEHLARTA